MKTIKLIAIAATVAAGTLFSGILSAQDQKDQQKKNNWKEKIQCEKIAYLTSVLKFTPEEAQVFWPVYNQIAENKAKLEKEARMALKDVKQAFKEEKSEKEIDKLFDKYIKAREAIQKAESESVPKLRKVIDGAKVAKLFIAEENFRRMQINKFNGNRGGQHPQFQGAHPQGGQRGGQHPQGHPQGAAAPNAANAQAGQK